MVTDPWAAPRGRLGRAGPDPDRARERNRVLVTAALVAVGAAYSGWVSSTTPFTSPADVAVAAGFLMMAFPAGAALLRGGRPSGTAGSGAADHAPPSAPDRPVVMAWTFALLFLLAVELVAYFAGWSGNRREFPTVSSLYDAAAATTAAKAAIVFVWMALGWGLFHRPPTDEPEGRDGT
jgi:hypothetical protein